MAGGTICPATSQIWSLTQGTSHEFDLATQSAISFWDTPIHQQDLRLKYLLSYVKLEQVIVDAIVREL